MVVPKQYGETENKLVVARGGGWVKQMKGIKRYKLPDI